MTQPYASAGIHFDMFFFCGYELCAAFMKCPCESLISIHRPNEHACGPDRCIVFIWGENLYVAESLCITASGLMKTGKKHTPSFLFSSVPVHPVSVICSSIVLLMSVYYAHSSMCYATCKAPGFPQSIFNWMQCSHRPPPQWGLCWTSGSQPHVVFTSIWSLIFK